MDRSFIDQVIQVAATIVTNPRFDGLHDPDKRTAAIEPYYDPSGYPTIGYGHLISNTPWDPLSKYPAITREEAESLLLQDLLIATNGVLGLVTTRLNVNQLAALVDFAFNAGLRNFKDSSLRKVVNRRDFQQVPKQFSRWIYSRGVKLPGLVKRRKAEAELFARPV